MSDVFKKIEYLKEYDVSIELSYRLNFDADKTCGHIKIFKGDLTKENEGREENYEIYMELFDCGLDEEQLMKSYSRFLEEIRNGDIDVGL